MTDTDTDDDLKHFAVFGLYRDQAMPAVVKATDVNHARRQYHDKFPGWEGTTFKVIEPDAEQESDDE